MATPNPEFGQVTTGRAGKFDPWRVVVRPWWGLGKPYEPAPEFVKRSWHKVDKLQYAVETLNGTIKLADAECSISYEIEVGYQPNVDFAKEWFRMHKLLPAAIFADFKPAIKGAVRDEFTRFTADNILNESDFFAAQANISSVIKSIFENKGITCDAYCHFERPVIEWPKQDPNTPQPLFSGQSFYESVKKQNAEFFLKQEKIRNDETADREKQSDENAKAVAERAASRRADARSRMLAENQDEILKGQLEDAKANALRARNTANDEAELAYKRDQKKRLMDAEKELREHRISLRKIDEDFIACESDLFKKEKERARAEEEVKQAATEVANEREVRFIRERVQAEKVVEILRQAELLKELPNVLEKFSGAQQPIEHLRVVQIASSGEKGPALPNSLSFHITQALSLIMEFLNGPDDKRP